MKSTSLGFNSALSNTHTVTVLRKAESPEENINTSETLQKCNVKVAIIILYSSVTILDFIRGIIHTFLYENGINDISGLSTGDVLCDNRLSAIMIGYGGSNFETFIIRVYILYIYTRYSRGRDLVRITSMASALFAPVTGIVSFIGNIDVGDAEVPGEHAMLIRRSVVSLGTFLLTFLDVS